ncbi:MAG: hypothetical protein ACTHMW_01630 [Actinomycetes bacterium]
MSRGCRLLSPVAAAAMLLALVACSSPDPMPAQATPAQATRVHASPTPAAAEQTGQTQQPAQQHRLPPVPRDGTVLAGVQLAWDVDTPADYIARTQVRPAVYGDFVDFPLSATALGSLRQRAAVLRTAGAALFLTVEPTSGLTAVTPTAAAAFARQLHEAVGDLPVYLRFAQEMNGSWYPWGEQPTEFVPAFRALAAAVHTEPGTVAMVWSPAYGGGYPFARGGHRAADGTPDFAVLDTTHDGRLTGADDPYAPYYPGDDAVDWVGLTDYFWGLRYPWGANELPDAGRLAAQLTGTYRGPGGDETAVPDFYATYAVAHRKPMALSETAALWNATTGAAPGGPTEVQVKSAWLRQVYDPRNETRFPLLKLELWFEHDKPEAEAHGNRIDWGIGHEARLVDLLHLLVAGPSSRYVQAPLPTS